MQTQEDKKRLALVLNAFVLPGLGHMMLGQKVKGLIISALVIFFLAFPFYRYLQTTADTFEKMYGNGELTIDVIVAMSQSWAMHKKMILLFLCGLIIVWLYGIIDIARQKNTEGGKNGM